MKSFLSPTSQGHFHSSHSHKSAHYEDGALGNHDDGFLERDFSHLFQRSELSRYPIAATGEVESAISIRAEWADRYGIPLFLGQAADRSLQRLRLILEANPAQLADQLRPFVAALMPRAFEVFRHWFHGDLPLDFVASKISGAIARFEALPAISPPRIALRDLWFVDLNQSAERRRCSSTIRELALGFGRTVRFRL